MSTPLRGRGAPRTRALRPVRTDYPDLSPTSSFAPHRAAPPRPVPLFVYVSGVMHKVRDLGREAGDPAVRVLELTDPDGAVRLVGDSAQWGHDCNCPDWLRTRGEDCPHILALIAAGALARPARWVPVDAEGGA
jgi:hypothetical protein